MASLSCRSVSLSVTAASGSRSAITKVALVILGVGVAGRKRQQVPPRLDRAPSVNIRRVDNFQLCHAVNQRVPRGGQLESCPPLGSAARCAAFPRHNSRGGRQCTVLVFSPPSGIEVCPSSAAPLAMFSAAGAQVNGQFQVQPRDPQHGEHLIVIAVVGQVQRRVLVGERRRSGRFGRRRKSARCRPASRRTVPGRGGFRLRRFGWRCQCLPHRWRWL